jgi:toxin ParE1/3/4
MAVPIISRPAQRDLLEILEFIARDNPVAALEQIESIEEKCQVLADRPDMGFPRDELLPGLRVWPVGRYLIFFRQKNEDIEVVRVLHSARDIPKLL